jgi:hypothetical protein
VLARSSMTHSLPSHSHLPAFDSTPQPLRIRPSRHHDHSSAIPASYIFIKHFAHSLQTYFTRPMPIIPLITDPVSKAAITRHLSRNVTANIARRSPYHSCRAAPVCSLRTTPIFGEVCHGPRAHSRTGRRPWGTSSTGCSNALEPYFLVIPPVFPQSSAPKTYPKTYLCNTSPPLLSHPKSLF